MCAPDVPPSLLSLIAIIAGIIGVAVCVGLSGVHKARTGANDVLVPIMLNSISGYAL